MKPTDSQNESGSAPRSGLPVPKVSGEAFQQSFAVAQLAVKLCELKRAGLKTELLKEAETPEKFLEEAWKLIESAREHVLRPATNAEYVAAAGGSYEAMEHVVGRILQASRVSFLTLCDPEYHNKGDSVTIDGIDWKVYRSERGFYDLFWDYWRDIGEKWKDAARKKTPVKFYSAAECEKLANLARDTDAWKKYGKSLLDSWKRDSVPPNDFLALAKFRRERDNRLANLKKRRTPKRKRRESRKERIRKS